MTDNAGPNGSDLISAIKNLKDTSGLTAAKLAEVKFPATKRHEIGYQTTAVDDWISEVGLRIEGMWQDVIRLLSQVPTPVPTTPSTASPSVGNVGISSAPVADDTPQRIGEAFVTAYAYIEKMIGEARQEADRIITAAKSQAAEIERHSIEVEQRAATVEVDTQRRAKATYEMIAGTYNDQLRIFAEQYQQFRTAIKDRMGNLQKILDSPLPAPNLKAISEVGPATVEQPPGAHHFGPPSDGDSRVVGKEPKGTANRSLPSPTLGALPSGDGQLDDSADRHRDEQNPAEPNEPKEPNEAKEPNKPDEPDDQPVNEPNDLTMMVHAVRSSVSDSDDPVGDSDNKNQNSAHRKRLRRDEVGTSGRTDPST
jgi:vacuolar-type H+-ATPase subunit H